MYLTVDVLLILQTSDSSSIFINKELFPHDDPNEEKPDLCYSINEGNNPLYWCDNWHRDLSKVISIMESPNRRVSVKRNYISWWLNCRPSFVDDLMKPMLKVRLETYYLTGEIRNAFKNANKGFEFNADCLLEWHSLLNVQCDNELLKLIPAGNNHISDDFSVITIGFVGFDSLPYKMISLKFRLSHNFQMLLNVIYEMIKYEVNQMSYGVDWVLYDSSIGAILEKIAINDTRHLSALGVVSFDGIICYKKSFLVGDSIY